MPGTQVQAFQDLELAEPELRLEPDDRRLNEVGWTRGDIGTVVRALGDGMFVGEYFDGERRLDMILRASKWESPEALASTPISTPAGNVMPLGELVRVDSTVGAGGLRRVDGHRTIGLNVSPPKDLSLGQAIEVLKRDVEPEIRAALPADGAIQYEGNAGSLREALANMAQNLAIALIALFLLLAALFRSVKDSLYVILTIPLASFGGVLALVLLRLFTPQTLDLLTMVGFVVLMGLVVNNAILLVDQARAEIRGGAAVRAAVESALATRTRPDHADHAHHAFRHVAAGADPGSRQRPVSRPRHRARGRHGRELGVHARAAAHAAAPHRKARAAGRAGARQTTHGSRMKLPRVRSRSRLRHGRRRPGRGRPRRRSPWWSPPRVPRTSAPASRRPARS